MLSVHLSLLETGKKCRLVQKINSKRVAIVPLEPNATNYLCKWALIDSFETKFLKITAFFSYSNEASFQESTDVNTELRSTLYKYDITTVPIRCEDVPFLRAVLILVYKLWCSRDQAAADACEGTKI